jgi:hypothetical protein
VASGKHTTTVVTLKQLAPNTVHHYLVKSVAEGGATLWDKGQFTTAKRVVTAELVTMVVNDDADALSAGDFSVWMRYDGESKQVLRDAGIDTGGTIHPKFKFVLSNPPIDFPFTVVVHEDDTDAFGAEFVGTDENFTRTIEVPYYLDEGAKVRQKFHCVHDYDVDVWVEFTVHYP